MTFEEWRLSIKIQSHFFSYTLWNIASWYVGDFLKNLGRNVLVVVLLILRKQNWRDNRRMKLINLFNYREKLNLWSMWRSGFHNCIFYEHLTLKSQYAMTRISKIDSNFAWYDIIHPFFHLVTPETQI